MIVWDAGTPTRPFLLLGSAGLASLIESTGLALTGLTIQGYEPLPL